MAFSSPETPTTKAFHLEKICPPEATGRDDSSGKTLFKSFANAASLFCYGGPAQGKGFVVDDRHTKKRKDTMSLLSVTHEGRSMKCESRTFWTPAVLKQVIGGVGALLAFGAQAGPTTTEFAYQSAAGDVVGGGVSGRYTGAGTTMNVRGDLNGLAVDIYPATGSAWTVNLAAPAEETLHPGRYFAAQHVYSYRGRQPGLLVAGDGPSCERVWGSFVINQIAADSAGHVTMLDATFLQRCGSDSAPPLIGTVKYQAPPLSFSYSSDDDDPLGRGRHDSYYGGTSVFNLENTVAYDGLRFDVSGKGYNWEVLVFPPAGQKLKPGSYSVTNSVETLGTPSHAKDAVLLVGYRNAETGDRNHYGMACPDVAIDDNYGISGKLVIESIARDKAGNVTGLNASYEQRCDGYTGALRGTIRYYR